MTYNPGFPNAPINYDHQNESAFRSMVQRALNDVGGTVVIEGAIGELYTGSFGDTLIHDGNEFVASTKFLVDMQFAAKIQFCDPVTEIIGHELFDEAAGDAGGFGGGGSGAGLLAQTVAGKTARRGDTDFLSTPGDEWDVTEWTGFGGATLSIEGTGKLQIGGSETDEFHGGLFNAIGAVNRQMVQGLLFFGTGGTSESYLGLSALATVAGGTPSLDGYVVQKQAGASSGDDRFTLFRAAAGAIAQTKEIENDHEQVHGNAWKTIAYSNHSPAAEADKEFEGWVEANDLLADGQPELDLSSVASGQIAFVKGAAGSASLARLTKMFVSTDGFIRVQNLPAGFKAKIFDSGDTELKSATAVSGTASLKVTDIWLEDIAYLTVTNVSDVEQSRFTVVNEVLYGGTVLDYNKTTLPSGSVRQTATGAKKGFIDFTQYTPGAGLPSDWYHIGTGSPTFSVGNDATEGNYLECDPPDSLERAVLYLPWDGLGSDNIEMLARVWVDTATTNRRIGGPGHHIWGTDSSDISGISGGMYMRTTIDFESTVLHHDMGSGFVPLAADMQEAEQDGVWMWVRYRRDNYDTVPAPDQADFKIKCWFGDLAAEPVAWDAEADNVVQIIELQASGMGWFLADNAFAGVQRIAYLSWSSDPADPPDEPAALPASAKWMIITNPTDDVTRVQIRGRIAPLTDPIIAGLALVREDTSGAHESWVFDNNEPANEYRMTFEKSGVGALYRPFYIRWDATQAMELLSPDDVGGPKFTFSAATDIVGAFSVTGVSTFTGNAQIVGFLEVTHSADEHLRLDHASATGNPMLTFYQNDVSAGHLQFLDTNNVLRLQSDAGRVEFWPNSTQRVLVRDASGADAVLTVLQPAGGPAGIRIDAVGTGWPNLQFYNDAVGRASIYHNESSVRLEINDLLGPILLRPGTSGSATTRATLQNADPYMIFELGTAGNQEFRLTSTSLTGWPTLGFYQQTNRRAYIVWDEGTTDLRIGSIEAGSAIVFWPQNVAVRVTFNEAAPHIHITGDEDEALRLGHESATGNPYISWYQQATRRAYIWWDDANTNLQYSTVETASYISFAPVETERFRINLNAPHLDLRAPTATMRLRSAGAAENVLLQFAQQDTVRARIEWDDGDTDLDIEAIEASSRINLLAPNGVHITNDLDVDGRFDLNQGIALGGGATATLGTIGGSGPTAAAQAQWLEVDIGGTAHWIPVWT